MSASSAEQLSIESITITSDRFLDKELDVTGIVDSIVVYENITMPYLTGYMLIFDDNDLFSSANLMGTERVEFTFKSALPINNLQEEITKTFIITSIDSHKHNDSVALLQCGLIEDHGYADGLIRLAKSYSGSGEEIISNICKDQFGKNVQFKFGSNTQTNKKSLQGDMKYLVPYISPLEACSNVCSRMCTDTYLPFFLFSSLYSDDLILTDLETILTTAPFNKDNPFVFSQAETINRPRDLESEMYVLNSFAAASNEDTLSMAQLGAIGSQYIHTNFTTGEADLRHVKVTEAIQALVDRGIVDPDHVVSLMDDLFIPQPTKTIGGLDQYNSAVFSLPTTSPYGDIFSLSESQGRQEGASRILKRGILAHMTKNMFNISGPGMVYTVKDLDRSVGNQINLTVLKNVMVGANRDGLAKVPDNKTSGYFIMTAKKYSFDVRDQLCTYTAECARLTNKKKVN